jgi:hypothetical protein
MKSEHVLDWFRVTSGQLWSFKLEDAHNRLHAHSDHHSPLNGGSHDRAIQDRVIFSYWIHHQPCDISEEGSHTWRWSNYSIKDSWSVWFEQRRPIGDFQSTGSPIRNRSSPGLMTCSGVTNDTSIFIRTRGHWISKIRQADQSIKKLGSTSNILRVIS